jgi:epoxyqueuosine reductase
MRLLGHSRYGTVAKLLYMVKMMAPSSDKNMNKSFEQRLESAANELGFVAFGIADADAAPRTAERLQQWLSDGCHGSMIWMESRSEQRGSPKGLWPDVQSVISLGMSYAPAQDPMHLAQQADIGRVSVYAQGADYHDIVKKALKALARWLVAEHPDTQLKVFVDTAPVMEKPLAEAAGLGWQGKHSNLVSREHGSWLFLGAIYVNFPLQPSLPARDRCGSCDACQRICPTNAFPAPYQVDARRCISYLTIEHDGPIPEELRRGIGNHIYGCDDCLSVCPWNKFAETAHRHRAFLPRAELTAPELSDILTLDDAAFRQIFAGSPIKRIGRNRMIRNAAIAAGNSNNRSYVPVLTKLSGDESEMVADAARWALDEIGKI